MRSLIILAFVTLGIGCEDHGKQDRSAPVANAIETHTIEKQIEYVKQACPEETRLMEMRDKCFASMNEREAMIDDLKRQVQSLQDDVRRAESESSDWQKKYYDYQCD